MATFSKRHYERVSAIMRRMMPVVTNPQHAFDSGVSEDLARKAQWEVTCDVFCREFAADNDSFKPDKFLTACGVK